MNLMLGFGMLFECAVNIAVQLLLSVILEEPMRNPAKMFLLR